MKIKDYQKATKRTLVDLPQNMDNSLHMCLGLSTEVGELADIFKRKLAYGKDIDLINVKEEIGDIMWYLANLCNFYNIDLEDCMAKNLAKLFARYPEKFTEDQALIRQLEIERKALETDGLHH